MSSMSRSRKIQVACLVIFIVALIVDVVLVNQDPPEMAATDSGSPLDVADSRPLAPPVGDRAESSGADGVSLEETDSPARDRTESVGTDDPTPEWMSSFGRFAEVSRENWRDIDVCVQQLLAECESGASRQEIRDRRAQCKASANTMVNRIVGEYARVVAGESRSLQEVSTVGWSSLLWHAAFEAPLATRATLNRIDQVNGCIDRRKAENSFSPT